MIDCQSNVKSSNLKTDPEGSAYLIGGRGSALVTVAGSLGGSRQARVRIGRAVQIHRSHTQQHRFLHRVDEHQTAFVAVGHPVQDYSGSSFFLNKRQQWRHIWQPVNDPVQRAQVILAKDPKTIEAS